MAIEIRDFYEHASDRSAPAPLTGDEGAPPVLDWNGRPTGRSGRLRRAFGRASKACHRAICEHARLLSQAMED